MGLLDSCVYFWEYFTLHLIVFHTALTIALVFLGLYISNIWSLCIAGWTFCVWYFLGFLHSSYGQRCKIFWCSYKGLYSRSIKIFLPMYIASSNVFRLLICLLEPWFNLSAAVVPHSRCYTSIFYAWTWWYCNPWWGLKFHMFFFSSIYCMLVY